MHPIVKEFITTESSFIEIFKKVGDPNQPVEVILPKLSTLTHKDASINLNLDQEIDDAINHGHPDEEVYEIFISILIIFCCIHSKKVNSESAY